MAYLEINMKVSPANRPAAAGSYKRSTDPCLDTIRGAKSKELLVRDEDVQVLHTFKTAGQARAYLSTELFPIAGVNALTPLLDAEPDIRIYDAA